MSPRENGRGITGEEGMNKLKEIEKIVDDWHYGRYDTDWDYLQSALSNIRKIIKS